MKKIIYLKSFTIFVLLFINYAYAAVQPSKNPNSAKSCAICHYRWVDTFFTEGKGSELVEYQSEKVVATAAMCFSCHDGSIKDSRARLSANFGHKTNILPPSNMSLPKLFPLDEDGKIQCATCHTAHGVPSGPDSKETIFMRTSNRNSAMCRMCHPAKTADTDAGNHPMGAAKQEIPRQLIERYGKVGDSPHQIVCETCHTAHGSPYESYLVKGAGDSGLCLSCHRDKSVFTAEGKRRSTHVVNVRPAKVKIPEGLIEKGAKLGDKGVITCQTCHKVHNNKIEKPLLLIAKDNQSGLCLSCHSDKHYIADTKHNLRHSAPGEKNLEGKTVAEAGICSACHLPHKAARKLSGKKDFTTDLCLSCHGKGNIAKKIQLTSNQHSLNINALENNVKNELTLPLFNNRGIQVKNGEMTCTTCHDPHRWQAYSAKGEIGKDSKGDRKTSFLRKQAPEICRECHLDKFHIANSKHDLAKTAPQEKNILEQTPSESGLCGNCHLVHNARQNYLWARKIGTKADNLASDLCLGCHNENGMAGKKVIKRLSHPLNISPYENGFSTTLPLFDLNGKISKNGVITCATCHNPHRWDPLKNIRKDHFKLEGSSQNSFLRLENSPAPELCANCHPDQALIEKTDHDLLVTASHSRNIMDQIPIESGTCGVCHLVHNGQSKIILWAQGFSSGNNIMERMCNSCHSEIGPGKDKIAQVYLHPREKLINNKGKNIRGRLNYFPLFHGKSGENVSSGNISCPSCHNVHQWDSKIFAIGKGVNAEGNATNSFLRSQASFGLCRDCHGSDAQFKIKYYHNADKRKFKGIDDLFFK